MKGNRPCGVREAMLEPTAPLWRYMKLSTFLLLLDGKAWLPSIATLRSMDPLEGKLGDDFHAHLWAELDRQSLRQETEEWLHEKLDASKKRLLGLNLDCHNLSSRVLGSAFAEVLASRRVAWCWFESDLESAGMWSIYGNRGIAVRTTSEQLAQSFPKGKEIVIEKMLYVDRRPCPANSLEQLSHERPEALLRPYFIKAVEYAHEGEVRLIAHCPEGATGVLVKEIKVENLINEIVISPLLPLGEAESIQRILEYRAPHFKGKIKQSSLNGMNGSTLSDRIGEELFGTTDENMNASELPSSLRKL